MLRVILLWWLCLLGAAVRGQDETEVPDIFFDFGTDAGDDVLALMERCWCERAADRPSFSDVTKQLIKINNRRCVSGVTNALIPIGILKTFWS